MLATLIDSLSPQAIAVIVLVALVGFGSLALVVAWRNWSDSRAARTPVTRLTRPPRNFRSGWDRTDEYGRPW